MGTMPRRFTAMRCAGPLLLTVATLWGQQYKADKSGPPPSELASGIAQALDPLGYQISANGAAYCELWLRRSVPSGAASGNQM